MNVESHPISHGGDRKARNRHALVAGTRAALVGALAFSLTGFVYAHDFIGESLSPASAAAGPEWDMRLEAAAFSGRSFSREELEMPALRNFVVAVDGQNIPIESNSATLAEALTLAGIVVGENDVVSADLNMLPQEGEVVAIQRVGDGQVVEEIVDPHATTEIKNDSMYKDERKVTTRGVDGLTVTTFTTTVVEGVEQSREMVAQAVLRTRVDEVVEVGTKERPAGWGTATPPTTTYAGDPVAIGQSMAADRGWTGDQWSCLYSLWKKESGWNPNAHNKSSGAHGIPQALPGNKMAKYGADWATNPATQIAWGLSYIEGRYGTPCNAWAHSQAKNWY